MYEFGAIKNIYILETCDETPDTEERELLVNELSERTFEYNVTRVEHCPAEYSITRLL